LNIFIFHEDHELNAQYHCDKHIVKMPLEVAQLLCTAHHMTGADYQIPYKKTHYNHPCSIWVRESHSNYLWAVKLGKELCKEYTYRYGKIHKTEAVIDWCRAHIPNIKNLEPTPFAQAMPDKYKHNDPVIAYRNYFIHEKSHLFGWKNRSEPHWIRKECLLLL
jgi:hypothetical protein